MTEETQGGQTIEPPRGVLATPRRVRPVLWWAAFGAVALTVQAWIYVSWITSDDFRTVTIGRGDVPGHERMWAWVLQAVFSLGALAAVTFVVRGCRRQRRNVSTCLRQVDQGFAVFCSGPAPVAAGRRARASWS